MNTNQRIVPDCKSYERPWRDWAVDRNLDDQWLERLNNLETLNLVSICEGHIDARPTSARRSPRIALMLKKAHMRPLTEQWYELKESLAREIERVWSNKETIIEFEIQHRLVKDEEALADIEGIIMRIASVRKRDMMIISVWIQKWFRKNISKIETFDQFMKILMTQREELSR